MIRFDENNEIIREEEYRAILVGLQLREDITHSMDELEGLAEADGVEVIGRMIQSLEKPNTATFIGTVSYTHLDNKRSFGDDRCSSG